MGTGDLWFLLDPLVHGGYGHYVFSCPPTSSMPRVESMMDRPPSKPTRLTGLYVRNFLANFTGNCIIILLNIFTPLAVYDNWKAYLWQGGGIGGWVHIPVALIVVVGIVIGLQYRIQHPIAIGLRQLGSGRKRDARVLAQARRRLVNLPSILWWTNLIVWIVLTSLFMPLMYSLIDMTIPSFFYGFFRLLMIGLVASFISFFLIDHYCRTKLIPVFFPGGRVAAVPGTIKISILRRIRVLWGAGTNAPMILLVGTIGFAVWEVQDYAVSAGQFGKEVLAFTIAVCLIFISISLILNFLAGRSILQPIKEMMRVIGKVRDGDFHQKVRVVSNDELGDLGDGINEMTVGLIERDQIRQSLYLAKEVQQALLPRSAPDIKGLDVASASVYCDETGGDYYDFFIPEEPDAGRIGIVVGDVSGHGISSALLMTTARAFFRQRFALPGRISAVVSDVNRLLAYDVGDSGGFMTLFLLSIDRLNRRLSWVRAGHDPAVFYDPEAGAVEELRGSGMAMGIDGDHDYRQFTRENLAAGQIILMGTDGIWEAQNSKGEMFGKDTIYRIIRQYSDTDAKGLLTACLYALDKFRDGVKPEDDVTLVVIKITDS
jgi:sigma-B regulation protein RsbU (phosphoserine phosphatase)